MRDEAELSAGGIPVSLKPFFQEYDFGIKESTVDSPGIDRGYRVDETGCAHHPRRTKGFH